jgi:hypothetical protein
VEVEGKDKEIVAAAPVYTSVKFTFEMESLIVDLFTGGSKEVCLCQFIFFIFSFSFSCLAFSCSFFSHFIILVFALLFITIF